jgi:hypothetical protein
VDFRGSKKMEKEDVSGVELDNSWLQSKAVFMLEIQVAFKAGTLE